MSRMGWEGGLQSNDRQAGRAEPAKETEDQRHQGRDTQEPEGAYSREMSRQWQRWGGQRERKGETVAEVELRNQGESEQKLLQR